MQTLAELLSQIKNQGQTLDFKQIIAFIEANYTFEPTKFTNGDQVNEAGQNSGSCKLFAFAQLQKLSQQETLACFGDYYRIDVLQKPEGTDHQNIRNFIKYGWEGIKFDSVALG